MSSPWRVTWQYQISCHTHNNSALPPEQENTSATNPPTNQIKQQTNQQTKPKPQPSSPNSIPWNQMPKYQLQDPQNSRDNSACVSPIIAKEDAFQLGDLPLRQIVAKILRFAKAPGFSGDEGPTWGVFATKGGNTKRIGNVAYWILKASFSFTRFAVLRQEIMEAA